jgi:hypothetical protein
MCSLQCWQHQHEFATCPTYKRARRCSAVAGSPHATYGMLQCHDACVPSYEGQERMHAVATHQQAMHSGLCHVTSGQLPTQRSCLEAGCCMPAPLQHREWHAWSKKLARQAQTPPAAYSPEHLLAMPPGTCSATCEAPRLVTASTCGYSLRSVVCVDGTHVPSTSAGDAKRHS